MAKLVVVLGGDGVGPEVTEAATHILRQAEYPLEIQTPPCGEEVVDEFGTAFPDEARELCDKADAILFGSTGEASILIMAYLRYVLKTYANVRPMKYYPGSYSPLANPSNIDFVIVRENLEGMYPGREGDISDLAQALPDYRDLVGKKFADFGEGKFAIRIITKEGTDRIARFACELARKRKKKGSMGKVTCVTKQNMLRESCGLFKARVEQVLKDYPELEYEHFHVDDAARRLVRFPQKMDVIVASNMFGDILSDLGAELVGGLGIAPSGCYSDEKAYFESVHGSAPDIAGKGIVNPTATILSAAMMLEYLGLEREASALENAVASVYRERNILTRDQGGTATTMQFAQAVLKKNT
ncbi:MAG: isocitrate/isopropylmalate dehydrogenase family protein [Candidatus Abyssobacteria bacterium SURF_17]|uniref:Isocitrate/isopropylmalate dehydrogenase family protein n=1 Tax=Candidatus Abyssobacteria bacterium SURF_17 TaxID=2093361 RepID=A0A419EVZ2_9BACT|nr:MAG: isocitrate/isopropylmalate dehydrogenase family protein [Candidatus Abyssubacteria bacterium SURF_17]